MIKLRFRYSHSVGKTYHFIVDNWIDKTGRWRKCRIRKDHLCDGCTAYLVAGSVVYAQLKNETPVRYMCRECMSAILETGTS